MCTAAVLAAPDHLHLKADAPQLDMLMHALYVHTRVNACFRPASYAQPASFNLISIDSATATCSPTPPLAAVGRPAFVVILLADDPFLGATPAAQAAQEAA